MLGIAVEQIGVAAERLTPNVRTEPFLDMGDAVVAQPHSVGGIGFVVFEAVSVESFQSVPCGQPYISLVVLQDALYGILRQSIFERVMPDIEKTFSPDGCQREDGKKKDEFSERHFTVWFFRRQEVLDWLIFTKIGKEEKEKQVCFKDS